jgi:hypothetical protein
MQMVLYKAERPRNEWTKHSVYYPEYTERGTFHTWGVSHVEFETGPGNYTVAVIEKPDGTFIEVPTNAVKFIY